MKQLLLITLLLLTTILFGNDDGPPEPEGPGEDIAAPEDVAPRKARGVAKQSQDPHMDLASPMRVQTKKKKKIIKKRSVVKPKATQPDKIPAQKVQKKSSGKRFSKREILSIIRKNQRKLQVCYERELRKDPRQSFMIKVKFKILSSGAVKVVKISGSEHQQFNSCIKKHMVRFKFPAGYRETKISYPFKFRSNN